MWTRALARRLASAATPASHRYAGRNGHQTDRRPENRSFATRYVTPNRYAIVDDSDATPTAEQHAGIVEEMRTTAFGP